MRKETKIIAKRFSLVEAYFRVLDVEYYEECKVNALKRIIKEIGFLSAKIRGIDCGDWEKYFEFKFDLKTIEGIYDAEMNLREDYEILKNEFIKGGN